MSVSEDGTLTIEPVQREDAGQYICKGLSIAGSAYAKARLDVRGPLLCTLFSCLAINCMNVRRKEGPIFSARCVCKNESSLHCHDVRPSVCLGWACIQCTLART